MRKFGWDDRDENLLLVVLFQMAPCTHLVLAVRVDLGCVDVVDVKNKTRDDELGKDEAKQPIQTQTHAVSKPYPSRVDYTLESNRLFDEQ